MSFFTAEELSSLRIARMCLHLVGGDDEFEPQGELPLEDDEFLLSVLKEIAADSVYRFAEVSATRDTIEKIAKRQTSFVSGAQALARDFCRFHSGGAKDGAFFVFELGVADQSTSIYALVKYDYSHALELVHSGASNKLREILQAFVDNKATVQKAAIIRTMNGVAEQPVSTRDRMGRPAPSLTEFFLNYLQVVRDRSDEELTEEVREVVRTVLKDHREHFGKGEMAERVARALDVLRSAPEVNEAVVRQAVWVGAGQPDDEAFKEQLDASTDRLIHKKRLAGVAFVPSASSLPKSVRRRVKTQEGITIEYNTSLVGQAIQTEKRGGKTRFIVTTEDYTDEVVTERVGQSRR